MEKKLQKNDNYPNIRFNNCMINLLGRLRECRKNVMQTLNVLVLFLRQRILNHFMRLSKTWYGWKHDLELI